MGIQISDSRLREMREIAAKQFIESAVIPTGTDLTVAMAAIAWVSLIDALKDHPGIWAEYRLREPLEDTVRVFVKVDTLDVVGKETRGLRYPCLRRPP